MKEKRYIMSLHFPPNDTFVNFDRFKNTNIHGVISFTKFMAYTFEYAKTEATILTQKDILDNLSKFDSILGKSKVCEVDKDLNILNEIPINQIQRYFKLEYL